MSLDEQIEELRQEILTCKRLLVGMINLQYHAMRVDDLAKVDKAITEIMAPNVNLR